MKTAPGVIDMCRVERADVANGKNGHLLAGVLKRDNEKRGARCLENSALNVFRCIVAANEKIQSKQTLVAR